jgi:hypothetical protein
MATINIIPPEQKLLVISQSSQDNEIPTITTKLNISDNYTNKVYINYIEKGIPGSQGPIGPIGPAGNPIIGVDNYSDITNYYIKLSDNCKLITINNNSNYCDIYLMNDLPIGFQCYLVQIGSYNLNISNTNIINNNSYTTIQYKLNQLVKISNNQFLLFGEGV